MVQSPQSLEIQIWHIDRLVFYARNPRKNDAAVDRMCSSIREFGFKIPVLARCDEAAKAVGIAPNTLLKWMKIPEFQAAYREARRNAYSQAVAKLQQGATAAATTLLKIMLDQNTPASVRVRAAECVMNHSSKAIEIEDVEARVTELERAAEASKQGR
jgi:hypothetical protein